MPLAVAETGNSKREVVRGGESGKHQFQLICGVGVPGGDFHEAISRRETWTKMGKRQSSEEHRMEKC